MDVNTLIEMGFTRQKIEKAIEVLGDQDMDTIFNWLVRHQEDSDEEKAANAVEDEPKPGCSYAADASENPCLDENKPADVPTDEAATASEAAAAGEATAAAAAAAKSIVCEDCKKKLRPEDVEFHAIKTGHENYSESSEEVKHMTEEERLEAVKKAESLIKQRRASHAEKKFRDDIENERNRRKIGQELASVRQKLEDQERKREAEAKRKEKREAHLDRMRVLQDIERDKLERQEKFAMGRPADAKSDMPELAAEAHADVDFDKCRLQIRLTNGDCLVETFNATEQLSAVRLFVQLNRTDEPGPFNFRTGFPRRIYTEEDMSAPLNCLDLCPKSVLIVSKAESMDDTC